MGHSVVYCDNCGSAVIESRNEWECDSCNCVCNASTDWVFKKKDLEEEKQIGQD